MQTLYGRPGTSVAGDLFGFFRCQVPASPAGFGPSIVSLKDFLGAIRGPHINLNMIEWGVDQFNDAKDDEMDFTIFRARALYAQVGIGIGRVQWFGVLTADAHGLDHPHSIDDAHEMMNGVNVANDGIDVEVPSENAMSDSEDSAAGNSPVDGPCEDKDGKLNGVFVGMVDRDGTPVNLAHELGHYLGLHHNDSNPLNVMFPASYGAWSYLVHFDAEQGSTMRDHCMVHGGLAV